MKTRALAVAWAVAACGCTTASFGRLDGVLKGNRPAVGAELAEVRIIRAGAEEPVREGMPLLKDDRIATGPGVSALITFHGSGTEVLLEPDSELQILNPSVFLRFGRAILSRLNELREEMKARTEYVVAAPEGTLWVMQVRGDEVNYAVVSGRVRIESPQRRWPSVVYGPLEQGHVAGPAAPVKMSPLDPLQARAIANELARAEKAVGRVRPPYPTEAPFDRGQPMPGLSGRSLKDAMAVLRRMGLEVSVEEIERRDAKPGTVVGQAPSAGERVYRDRAVRLVVARQPPPDVKPCRVPSLLRLSPRQALSVLRRAGLELDRSSDMNGTRVVAQDPAAGQPVACGSPVRITVEKPPVIQ